MKNKNRNLVKIRLSNCRNIKPFWADINDVNSSFRELNDFINKYIHRDDNLEIRGRHHLIFFHQLPAYKVDGFEVKTHKTAKPPYHGLMKIKYYRRRYADKLYSTNTKTDYWAKNEISPIPLLKVIDNVKNLKDPSGINYFSKSQTTEIITNNCFGVFYNNTLAYARMNGCNINLHLDCVMEDSTHKYLTNVSAADMLNMMYKYYKFGITALSTQKRILRHITNSTFGMLSSHITSFYTSYVGDVINDYEYGKIIISYSDDKYEHWREIPLMVNNQQYRVISEIENFIKETNIDFSNTTLNVTFKSDTISKVADIIANS